MAKLTELTTQVRAQLEQKDDKTDSKENPKAKKIWNAIGPKK